MTEQNRKLKEKTDKFEDVKKSAKASSDFGKSMYNLLKSTDNYINDMANDYNTVISQYSAYFMGMRIFIVVIGLLLLIEHKAVLQEGVKWVLARIDNISSLFIFLKDVYFYVSDKFSLVGIPVIICYIITAILSALLIIIFIFISIKGIEFVKEKLSYIRKAYNTEIWQLKKSISISVVLSAFYICVFIYEPIKNILPINIFSFWQILSAIGIFVINYKEIKKGLM